MSPARPTSLLARRTGAAGRGAVALLLGALACAPGCARHALLARGGARASDQQFVVVSPAARSVAAHAFDQGVAAYTRGETARALASFELAYATAPAPEVMYNLARVHDELGHDADAARCYLAYLRSGVASAEQRREVDAALARLAPRVAWLLVRARGTVTVDGVPVAADVADAAGVPVPVAPGLRSVQTEQLATPVAARARVGEALALDFASPDALVVVAARPLAELRAALAAQIQPAVAAVAAR